MSETHSNIELLQRFDPSDPATFATAFSEDAVFHFFNPLLPGIAGDYRGPDGIRAFFEAMAEKTAGTFKVNVVDTRAVGDELVVVQTRNEMVLDGKPVATDVVVVWRMVGGKIVEVWDIPSIYT